MKRLSLLIALFGIFVLGMLMFKIKAVDIKNLKDIERLEINTKVKLEGKVIEERILFEGTKLIKIRDLEIICECRRSFKGNEIRVVGLVEEFDGKRQVRALRIEVLN